MLAIISVLVISAITIAGSWYARRTNRPDALVGLYVIFVCASNIIATKIAVFDLIIWQVTAPAAVLVFAVTFLMTDVVNERFGRAEVHRMIFIAFTANIALIIFLWLAGQLPPAPFWTNQEAWDAILGMVPRITAASLVTFLVSENLDAYLFHMLRQMTGGAHLWMRNVFSSIISLTVDTVFFVFLAFSGTGLPLIPLMIGQFAAKYLVAIIDIPFMYINRYVLGIKGKDDVTVRP